MTRKRHAKTETETSPAATERPQSRLYPANSTIESFLYWTIYLGIYAYSVYTAYLASNEYRKDLPNHSFAPGWAWLGREKDIANDEWTFDRNWAAILWPWFTGHVVVSKISSALFPKARKFVFLFYTLTSLTVLLGWRALLIQIIHCTLSYIVATTTRAALLVWFVNIVLMSSLNFSTFVDPLKELFDLDPGDNKYRFIIFTTALLNMRYTSFALEACRKPKPGGEVLPSCGFIDMLVYCFYFPLFFCGPIITYDKFYVQINRTPKPWSRQRILSYSVTCVRLVFWALFYELTLHIVYVDAITQNPRILRACSIWVLAGVGIMTAQYFMVKYVVVFGTTAMLARIDDFDPPEQPQCVAYIYLYSHLWKYFDRGLYNYLKRYIYLPLGGSTKGILRKQIASFACFAYVCYFHGAEYSLVVWIVSNFVAMFLEGVRTYVISIRRMNAPTPTPMERRVTAFCSIPFLWFGTFGCLYFLVGGTGGYIYINRTISDGLVTFMVCVTHYSQIQVSMDVERWKALRFPGGDIRK